MGTGYSPLFPLDSDSEDGHYVTNKTVKDMVKQNVRVLFLTSPGERVMSRNFGIGLRQFLFEPDLPQTRILLESRIREQVATYIPYIKIVQIGFSSQLDQPSVASNQLNLKFAYFITSTAETDIIEFESKPFGGVISS
mgnify:FL=1|tara:strand:+ start:216 stop:629 length:414 start_codon:yes stop_codon:yes gene_type:complete